MTLWDIHYHGGRVERGVPLPAPAASIMDHVIVGDASGRWVSLKERGIL